MVLTSVRPDRTRAQLFTMALLRIAVGWHFAYEGLAKLFDPQWSAEGYLRSANWVGAGLFHRLAENPTLLAITNQVNMWALVVIGRR
jgi:thiosulfate dehydrogenase (quinone) large subunit